ncbi:MAG: hypothetical protein IKU62_01155 [Ruminiclostridium sp.]|nr:hypothetical protein [Ruminiclostridium sp.]
MKKFLTLLALSMALILTLTACGGSSSEPAGDADVPVVEGDTLSADLANVFLPLAVEGSADATALAETVTADLPFEAMVMPVEPGLLMGFGNVEITGFDQAVMFGPAISTIPFLGYVFDLADGTDGGEFCQTLQESCDLRWNICTEAEEVIAVQGGDYVFFLMCPSSLEG